MSTMQAPIERRKIMTLSHKRSSIPGAIWRTKFGLIAVTALCLGGGAHCLAVGDDETLWRRFRIVLDGYGANMWPLGSDEKRITRFAADLSALSPEVSQSEARKLAECAQVSMNELRRKYRVIWPPLFHIVLIYYRHRDLGYCFQWTDDLYTRLQSLKLRTLVVGRAIAYENGHYENNCVVVSARGRPLREAIVIDGWRYSGRLAWLPVSKDHYPWKPYIPRKANVANESTSQRGKKAALKNRKNHRDPRRALSGAS